MSGMEMTGIRLGWKRYGYDRDYDRVFVEVSIGKKNPND